MSFEGRRTALLYPRAVILSASDVDARSEIPAPAGKNLNVDPASTSNHDAYHHAKEAPIFYLTPYLPPWYNVFVQNYVSPPARRPKILSIQIQLYGDFYVYS